MKKNYSLSLLAFLCLVLSGYGQTKIDEITFETAGGYTTSVAEFTDNGTDYFTRTDGSNIGGAVNFTNIQGSYYFAVQDTNGDGGPDNLSLNFNGINISGYSNLELRIHIAEDDDGTNQDWDGNTFMHIMGSIDTAVAQNILWVEASGDTNAEPRIDTNFDGTGNGTVISDDFSQFTANIAGVGSDLDLEIEFNGLEAGDEDIAIDSIEIWGISTCTDAVDFENIYLPTTSPLTINQGDPFIVRTQAVEPGVTTFPGEAAGIEAWIGYSTTDNNPSTSSGWTWIAATYETDIGANDVHLADIGSCLSPGTYYYATRHRLNGCTYTYGGTLGPYWSNDSQVLIVSGPPVADVVITEIMYNSSGADDEWIEICNVSGSNQFLNNYTIEVGGTTEFTFPSCGVELANGDCITIALGEDTVNPDFNPDCPFTPDYTNGAETGTLNNTSDTISLIASDGTTIIDTVTYDDGDGADNTGESLHVVDATLDNSVTNTNWWEVLNGGSPGINSLISPCTPVGPEINVEGNVGNFPDLANPDMTPSTFDGTDFGDLAVNSTLISEFRIENFGGTQNLNITSVTVVSGDVADFAITALPASTITPANPTGFSIFEVQFQPTVPGTRTAFIEIRSNDVDGDPFLFTVTGNGLCVANAITALPASGPAGTLVTVTGTNLATATASFNGLAATVQNISATEMVVTVPAGATTGNLEISDSLGCPGSAPFTVFDNVIGSCEGSGGLTPAELFISEVTDKSPGSHSYIEIYNGTGADVDLTDYRIEVWNNGNPPSNPAFNIADLTGTIANNSTYVIGIGNADAGDMEGGYTADDTFGNVSGINNNDNIRLYNLTNWVDVWGDTSGNPFTISGSDYTYRRKNTGITVPNTYGGTNWNPTDWDSFSPVDYTDIGVFDFSTGLPPIFNSIVSTITACNEATVSVAASEGFVNGAALQYIWYYYNPAQSGLGWQVVPNAGVFTTDPNSSDLFISDAASVITYQFYCEIREDDATCYTASDATKVIVGTATWDGSWNWDDGTAINTVPTATNNVIIDANYDTAVGGPQTSFEACNCIVNAGTVPNPTTLTIADNTYVLVENNLTVNGNIVVSPYGSFVQVNDAGLVDGDVLTDKTKISVEKRTAPLASYREYTYWSSPVVGEIISDGLFESGLGRVYRFFGENFSDGTAETNNDGGTVAGQDDIDDDANDWQRITAANAGTTVMLPGTGYAATHSSVGFIPAQYIYTFEGPFNNGVYNIPIFRNDNETNDNNWNFIGNPYSSAISVDGPNGFLNQNIAIIDGAVTGGAIDGAIFLWSHNTVADADTNGNEAQNYAQSDYAIINGTGGTMGGDMVMPGRTIPSGQGFFVSMANGATATNTGGNIWTADIVFNNSMRVTGANDQFFRNSTTNVPNKLWLDLTSDNGIFNQILVAYVDGATDDYDGMYYDAHKNLSNEANSSLYSIIASSDKKFAIQGKDTNSLNTDEIIPLGFSTTIDVPTIYTISIHQFEGLFLEDNAVYVADYLLNTIHNLKTSAYNFTSEPGEFNERFEIVFRADALTIDDAVLNPNILTIIELGNGDVQIKVSENLTIASVKIVDVLGRQIYNLQGSNSTEIYNLSQLSKAAYIAKVTLSNGQVITKKAIKRK